MLELFRKYQRYIFGVITAAIILSFSFFGTYNTLGSNNWREEIAFTAVNGTEISRAEVEDMALFIATDSEDKALYGGAWGPNFLNDGVIRKDFLETGLAQEMIAFFHSDFAEELQKRFAKELTYTSYQHPQASFLTASAAWDYFAPEINRELAALPSYTDPTAKDALDTRVKLYLAERKFPPHFLKQLIRYQEKQYDWVVADPFLERANLALFGYQTTDDWFGPQFRKMISQFIINASLVAESKGYRVSSTEALTDLIQRAQESFLRYQNNPSIGVTNVGEYIKEQLHLLNIDQTRAVKLWRQILLFRRYFQDVGAVALVDPLSVAPFADPNQDYLEVDLYQLPEELRLNDSKGWLNFELYLAAVSPPSSTTSLDLPVQFLPPAEVAKSYPELVQKRVLLNSAHVPYKQLLANIPVKEVWAWELNEGNWPVLKEQFRILGNRTALPANPSREERLAALDALDAATRSRLDAFAKAEIIKGRPDWMLKLLSDAKIEKKELFLRTEGGAAPLPGLNTKESRAAFMQLLAEASLNAAPSPESPLFAYTPDQQNYYRITVVERSEEPSLLTFGQANRDRTLMEIKNRVLERYYLAHRNENLLLYKQPDSKWQPFEAVQDLVLNQFLDAKTKQLNQLAKNDPLLAASLGSSNEALTQERAASLRLYPHLKKMQTTLQQNPEQASTLLRSEGENQETPSATNQWLLLKTTAKLDSSHSAALSKNFFSLSPGEWSPVEIPFNGDLSFFKVIDKGTDTAKAAASSAQAARLAHQSLGMEAQRLLLLSLLEQIKTKGAFLFSQNQKMQDNPP